MTQYLLTVSYDGSRYRGWQTQTNTSNTIQAKFKQLLERAYNQPVDVQGASRTDAGVHALGQRVSFSLKDDLRPQDVRQTINQYLPEDIAVLDCQVVDSSFHVRHQVKQKTYRYRIFENDKPDVFLRNYEWTVSELLDVEAMRESLIGLLGKHDFQGFTVGRATKKTVRTIHQLELVESPRDQGRQMDLIITGDGFLHHMIRLIVGTMVAIGRGDLPINQLDRVRLTGDRSLAILAPPQGLCLMAVEYELAD